MRRNWLLRIVVVAGLVGGLTMLTLGSQGHLALSDVPHHWSLLSVHSAVCFETSGDHSVHFLLPHEAPLGHSSTGQHLFGHIHRHRHHIEHGA